ncbi:hypothetical protein, partial [Jannaschia formosa]|uniref:hypothetical protein n=1 Tax=Jannaschia formosa TaxID=2259592 RepID=UPI001ADD9F27
EPPQTGQVGARDSPRMKGTANRLALDAGQNASIADFFNSIRTKLPFMSMGTSEPHAAAWE